MVNHGPSKGCNTCRARRVKCDEGKPSCQRCIRRDQECGGYERKPVQIKFKVQTAANREQKQKPRKKQACGALSTTPPLRFVESIPPFLEPVERDVALGFFLTNFAGVGRGLASARGLFEVLAPVLASELPSSAAYMAVTAVSTRLFRMWRHKDIINFEFPHKSHVDALARLRVSLRDPIERKSHATTLAALVLQFYENLFAVHNLQKASRTHHDGAVGLLMSQDQGTPGMAIGNHLLGYILHSEVSYSIRSKMPFPAYLHTWILRHPAPMNLSSRLDMVGISIANLQNNFCRLFCGSNAKSISPVDIEALWFDAKSTEARLLAWLQEMPSHWHPLRLQQVQDAIPPIVTYIDSCDVYPSVQVAAIWQTWRSYRLLLLKIKLSILQLVPGGMLDTILSGNNNADKQVDLICSAEDTVQQLIDSICHSVPFYLGNQNERVSLPVMTDPSIVHPSYHHLEPWDTCFIDYMTSDDYMTADAHKAHVVAYGAWHILNILTTVLNLLSEQCGCFLSQALRQGQKEWIQEQFGRASVILSLKTNKAFHDFEKSRVKSNDVEEGLVERVREGLRVTSGS
ncbi:hypothetical protein NM208_g4799 [Fusarium decemcellulare]|uniref:Uncharacterized protein n=1 Tax=Fusarium decemcellulare TaxID=57161 RepID=A0ACC1SJB4_9HYPO|nr:hypothetical protein NM208_g4799 [Fusarium decemcellulare]